MEVHNFVALVLIEFVKFLITVSFAFYSFTIHCGLENRTEIRSVGIRSVARQLGIVAFFFAMCSCEYLTTPTPKHKKRMKILCINTIRFFTKGKLIPHYSKNLHRADTVTITFEMQKSDERNESVTIHRTGDKIMCPVIMAANIVRRILTYPKTTSNSQKNLFTIGNRIQELKSPQMVEKLRSAGRLVTEENLGFSVNEIGTHYIRSGAAMSLFLGQNFLDNDDWTLEFRCFS